MVPEREDEVVIVEELVIEVVLELPPQPVRITKVINKRDTTKKNPLTLFLNIMYGHYPPVIFLSLALFQGISFQLFSE
jgi:hypothetical protein